MCIWGGVSHCLCDVRMLLDPERRCDEEAEEMGGQKSREAVEVDLHIQS